MTMRSAVDPVFLGAGWLDLRADDNLAAALLDPPAGERAERRRGQRIAGRQIETGMMPGTADGVADHQPVGERPMIMRAMGRDRGDFAAVAHQQHVLVADMARQHGAVGEIG